MFESMEPIGLDTLKATRTLRAAGFEAAKAEALVAVFGGPVLGNVATKEDLSHLRAEFRDLRTEFRDLRADFGDLRGEFADLRGEFQDLRGDFQDFRTEIRAELKAEINGFRAELKAEINGLRAEMKAEIGELREEQTGMRADIAQLTRDVAILQREHVTKAQMYRLLLVQATVIVGLVVTLQQLL